MSKCSPQDPVLKHSHSVFFTSSGYQGIFPWGKLAGEWYWPLTTI
jgi:hypothetical protein